MTSARERAGRVATAAGGDEIGGRALAILMALRIKGRATCDAVATAAGTTADETRAALAAARAAGLLQPVAGTPRAEEAVVLTATGQAELLALLAREPRDAAALASGYDRFLTVDAVVKTAITAWQLAPGEAGRAVDGVALRAAGAEAIGVAERLAALVPRYAAYARRLRVALRAWGAGDPRYAASPRVDSLHQVWFELHQDLLLTLGRERGT